MRNEFRSHPSITYIVLINPAPRSRSTTTSLRHPDRLIEEYSYVVVYRLFIVPSASSAFLGWNINKFDGVDFHQNNLFVPFACSQLNAPTVDRDRVRLGGFQRLIPVSEFNYYSAGKNCTRASPLNVN